MQKWCEKCKVTKLPNENYCYTCGLKLVDAHHCDCGELIYGQYIFCPKCGNQLRGEGK